MNAKTSPNDLLRRLRVERGWSQQTVAELLQNMGGATDSKLVGKWERGKHKPSPFYQERLCKLYGLSASQLGFCLPEESPAQGQEQQEVGEQHYLNLALQILEMAASEYQWSSDVLPSPHQKTAANQAAACYGLRSLLGYHLESLAVAEEDAKQFLYYSKLTEDPEWIVRAHVRFALISYYRGQPERALVACREANRYKNQIPPAALFSLYKEQASYEAQIGLKDEANASLHLAYENLLRATRGQSHAYVDTSLYEWALWKGITHYHLAEYKEAKITFASVAPLNPDSSLPERVRTGLLNNLVFAELRAKERDMEQCIMLWRHAVEWAKKLQSELRLAEVRRAYDCLVLAFPHEPHVAALKEQII
jgi:transcriptional regulator with XRE-family HTH domain